MWQGTVIIFYTSNLNTFYFWVIIAKEAADLAAAEAQKIGQAVDHGVNQASAVIDNSKQAIGQTVNQVNSMATNSKEVNIL